MPQLRETTQLLRAWSDGDPAALEKLIPLVDGELRRLAKRYLGGERRGHILQTTALVNEAFLRLVGWQDVSWQNRAHFFGVSAQVMRRVLVDYARRRPRVDRNVEARHVHLEEAVDLSPDRGRDVVALDDALKGLEQIDARKSKIVELRFFGGLSVEETAEVLKLSPATVMREWNKAKAWL